MNLFSRKTTPRTFVYAGGDDTPLGLQNKQSELTRKKPFEHENITAAAR